MNAKHFHCDHHKQRHLSMSISFTSNSLTLDTGEGGKMLRMLKRQSDGEKPRSVTVTYLPPYSRT